MDNSKMDRISKHTSPEKVRMVNRHMKICSTCLTSRGLQIKNTMKYHFTLFRMAIIKMSANKCWRGCGEKGTFLHCWWELKLVQPLWRKLWWLLKKLKIELPYNPMILVLGIQLEKTIIQKDTYTPVLIAALFKIVKTWKQLKWPLMNG